MFAAMHLSSIYCVVTYCSKCYFGHLIIMIYKIHLLLAIVTLIWFMYFIHLLSYVNRSVRLCNLSTSYYVIFLLN
jgi:uncharacterized membrane protein